MKVSEVIADICEEADCKWGLGGHGNNTVSVQIYSSGDDWQVSLQRPTKKQLDCGEVEMHMLYTIKQYEYLTGFFTVAATLPEALRELQERVQNATEWEQ